ncbi:MAG: prepilin peptidase [Phototrophicaceae bacterium]
MLNVLLIVIGFVVGVFINWLADELPLYRLPKRPSFINGEPRPLIQISGLVATLINRHQIMKPLRYVLVELGTPLLFIGIWYRIGWIQAHSSNLEVNLPQSILWMIYLALFILVMVIDIEHRLILYSVMIPMSLLAIGDAVWSDIFIAKPHIIEALLGGVLGFGVFFVFYMGGFLYLQISSELRSQTTDEVAFGYGDVILSTVAGLILGWRRMIFAMFITVVLGAIGALVYMIGQGILRKRNALLTPLPYGPYIVIGTMLLLYYSDSVRAFLLFNTLD